MQQGRLLAGRESGKDRVQSPERPSFGQVWALACHWGVRGNEVERAVGTGGRRAAEPHPHQCFRDSTMATGGGRLGGVSWRPASVWQISVAHLI